MRGDQTRRGQRQDTRSILGYQQTTDPNIGLSRAGFMVLRGVCCLAQMVKVSCALATPAGLGNQAPLARESLSAPHPVVEITLASAPPLRLRVPSDFILRSYADDRGRISDLVLKIPESTLGISPDPKHMLDVGEDPWIEIYLKCDPRQLLGQSLLDVVRLKPMVVSNKKDDAGYTVFLQSPQSFSILAELHVNPYPDGKPVFFSCQTQLFQQRPTCQSKQYFSKGVVSFIDVGRQSANVMLTKFLLAEAYVSGLIQYK